MSDQPFEPVSVEARKAGAVDLNQYHEEGPPCLCCGSCHYLRMPGAANAAQAHKAWCRPMATLVARIQANEKLDARNFETAQRVMSLGTLFEGLGSALKATQAAVETSSELHAKAGIVFQSMLEKITALEVVRVDQATRLEWCGKTINLLIGRVEALEGKGSTVRQDIADRLTTKNLQSAPEHEGG